MKKIKAGRSDIIKIAKSKYKLVKEKPTGDFDYNKWVEFIETHKDYFVWYEDTDDGKYRLENMDKVPDWAKEGVIYGLNKTTAYSTDKIVKNRYDLIVKYSSSDGLINISIEKKMSKKMAEILLKMAEYVGGKLIINGTKELETVEQLD